MCFLFYSTCQQCRSLIKSDLPRCWTTDKTKVFFWAGGWSRHLGQTRQDNPNPHKKKLWILLSLSCLIPHAQDRRRGRLITDVLFYFIQHVNSVEVWFSLICPDVGPQRNQSFFLGRRLVKTSWPDKTRQDKTWRPPGWSRHRGQTRHDKVKHEDPQLASKNFLVSAWSSSLDPTTVSYTHLTLPTILLV